MPPPWRRGETQSGGRQWRQRRRHQRCRQRPQGEEMTTERLTAACARMGRGATVVTSASEVFSTVRRRRGLEGGLPLNGALPQTSPGPGPGGCQYQQGWDKDSGHSAKAPQGSSCRAPGGG